MTQNRPALFIIMNHELTAEQRENAKLALNIGKFCSLPESLRPAWCSIPPELESLNQLLYPIKEWLCTEAKRGDYVLIQGDPGACFIMANYCIVQGMRPIYSTTKRDVKEERLSDGTVKLIRQFKHVRFRLYGS